MRLARSRTADGAVVPVAGRGDRWFDLRPLTGRAGPESLSAAALSGIRAAIEADDDGLIPRLSAKTDYEVELAVVLGATARYLDSPGEARACAAGFAISNDVSERESQTERHGQVGQGQEL